MKILFPLEVFYPSQAGGAANSVHYITKYLDKSRFEPIVIATDRGLPENVATSRWIENEDGRVMFVKTRHNYFPVKATVTALTRLARTDVIHLSSIFFSAAFIVGLVGGLLKKKF